MSICLPDKLLHVAPTAGATGARASVLAAGLSTTTIMDFGQHVANLHWLGDPGDW